MEYLRQLFGLAFAISVMYILLDCEIKRNRNRYLLGIYITVVIICDAFILYNMGYTNFMKLYPLLVNLPVFFAFVFLSKFKLIKVFFILLTLVAITTSFTLVGLIFMFIFDTSREIANIITLNLYLPSFFLIYKYIRPSFIYMMNNNDKSWLIFSIIPLSYSVFIYSMGMYNMDEVISLFKIKNAVLLFILVFSAYFLILQFFKQTEERLTMKIEQNLLITQVTAAQNHFIALEESKEKTILYQHDMRHHLNLINSYLIDNNREGAHKYIKELEHSIEIAVVEKYCNNYSVNLILSSYITKAKNEDITVKTQIDIPEQNVVSDMDLCVIFANAIENAINACKEISNSNRKIIKISSRMTNNKLYIQITNSFDGTIIFIEDMPIRPEGSHGLGTKSIAAVAQKYGGVYSFTTENGIFKASIIL